MYVAGQKEMQMLDQYTMEKLGLPGIVLMENAGSAVVQEIMEHFPSKQTKMVVLAGGGNNGGDGFVIARRLIDYGYSVKLCLMVREEKIKGDGKIHFEVYKNRNLPLVDIQIDGLERIMEEVECSEVIVDALLGTGVKGPVRSPLKELISFINSLGKVVYSVDIPSGVNADTGIVENIAIKATKTITFALPKLGFFLKDGPRYIGEWKVANISVPEEMVSILKLSLPRLMNESIVKDALPKRRQDGHKGTFGHCLVVGGSRSFVGAPIYTAKAAFYTGVGLVSLAIPESIYAPVASQCSEALLYPFSFETGNYPLDLQKMKAVAFGPGLGRGEEGRRAWKQLISQLTKQTIIVDADGLYFAKDDLNLLKNYLGDVIFTPHPGEMAILTGLTVKEIENNRIEVAKQFASQYGIYTVLKGHRPIIATPTGEVWINPYGNDSLSKGGSGDVLTGLITSFVTQGATPLEGIQVACYLHGKAGEELSKKISSYSVSPNDLIQFSRYELKNFLSSKRNDMFEQV